MTKWIPTFVLPDIFISDSVEGGMAAVANCDDPRVQQILADIPVLAQFVQKFTNAFGRKIRPSMLILRDDVPKSFLTVDAVASFRDLVAMSVVPLSRARSIVWQRSFATFYSDWYDFYPWMINTAHQHLVCHTPALAGLETIDDFHGQGAPDLANIILEKRDFDTVMLQALIKRWRRRYGQRSASWADVALFRSLNMAVAASKMPATVDTTLFSLGRSVGLWVSAFEILAHPKIGRSNLHLVYSLLDSAPWQGKNLRRKRYRAFVTANRQKQNNAPLRSLPCWLYGEIYHARNDFLHGNPIRINRLRVKVSGRSLFQYAPLLYRMALSAFLPLKLSLTAPPASRAKAYGKYLAKYFAFYYEQRDIEQGITTVREKPKGL